MTTDQAHAMHDARRIDSQRKRALVLAAADAAVLRGGNATISGIARNAGVGRKFIYDHPDLRAEIELKAAHASQRQANDIVAAGRVSVASLRADLANSQAQNRRLTTQLRALETRLSQLEGARLVADDLLPENMVAELADRQLSQRVAELEQQLFDAKEGLRRTVEELEAARTINRELIQQANRPRPAPVAESSRRSRGPSGPTTTKEERR
jgi:chromosome segregation ATPase